MTRLHADGRADIAYDDGDEEEGVDPKWIKDRIEDCHPARAAAAQAATVGTVVAPTAQAVAAGEASVPSSAIQVGLVPAAPPRRAPLAAEAEGLRLHLSSNNTTGYKGVFRQSKSHRFEAKRRVGKSRVALGTFDTAVEAAVAYARAAAAPADSSWSSGGSSGAEPSTSAAEFEVGCAGVRPG